MTARRTRRKAVTRLQWRRVQESEAAKFAEQRRAVKQQIAQRQQTHQQVRSNPMLDAASRAAATERYLHIRNVDNMSTAMEVAEYLARNIGQRIDRILRVEVRHRGLAAWALVTVDSQEVADMLMHARWMYGRHLKCSITGSDSSSYRRRGPHSAVFPARQLILRKHNQDQANDLVAGFIASRGVLFELSGRNHRQLGIEFDKARIEFGLQSLVHHELREIRSAFGNAVLVLRLVLREPPLCFSLFVPDNPMEYRENFSSILLQGVIHKNPMIWDPSPGAELGRGATGVWERTTDPSGESAFGHCLLYDIVFEQAHRGKLIEKLNSFALYQASPIPAQVSLIMPEVTVPSKHDWSGGYDDIFAPVVFSIRYMIHAAVASHKLAFISANEAKRVSFVLQQCTSVRHALNALEDLLRAPLQKNSVTVLLENIRNPPEVEDDSIIDDSVESLPGSAESLCLTRRVLVTPLRVCPQLPEMEVSNRVLREFSRFNERFVRVTFVDEHFESILQAKTSDIFDNRIRSLLNKGIIIAGSRYVFLAFSNSQLREQSAWFYDEGPRYPSHLQKVPTASEIRASMGDLSSITIVGKYAARLGQGFSSTTRGAKIPPGQHHTIPDVVRNGYTFSDGVGMISYEVARKIQEAMELEYLPSAMQIRFGGSKGVVSICPPGISMPKGKHLLLRTSMNKFVGNPEHQELEVCSVAKAMPCYLNRQIITVLSAMSVPDKSFLTLLEEMISEMQSCTTSNERAKPFLQSYANQSFVIRLLEAGYPVARDRFLREWIAAVRNRAVINLRIKARIYVPKGIVLMGIMDETHTLPPNQVFFQSRDPARQMPPAGTMMAIGRNPCLHPGDIRLLKMANIMDFSWLADLYDVLVFSAQGPRPQANMMSGGDLDGDLYFVIWDPSIVLHALEQTPMQYTPAVASVPKDSYMSFGFGSSPTVTNDQIKDFFVNYMRNDNLGQIANAHVAFADISVPGANSDECIRLAELHSTAVDFCKTGVPAQLPRDLIARSYPHFMENRIKPSYESRKILGKIYNIACNSANKVHGDGRHKNGSNDYLTNGFDEWLLIDGYEQYVDDAWIVLNEYMMGLWDIACEYQVWEEAELVSGYVSFRDRAQKRSGDGIARMGMAVRALQHVYKDEFWKEFGIIAADAAHQNERVEPFPDKVLAKAAAWYFCAYKYTDDSGLAPYLSFAWLALRPMCQLRTQVHGNVTY